MLNYQARNRANSIMMALSQIPRAGDAAPRGWAKRLAEICAPLGAQTADGPEMVSRYAIGRITVVLASAIQVEKQKPTPSIALVMAGLPREPGRAAVPTSRHFEALGLEQLRSAAAAEDLDGAAEGLTRLAHGVGMDSQTLHNYTVGAMALAFFRAQHSVPGSGYSPRWPDGTMDTDALANTLWNAGRDVYVDEVLGGLKKSYERASRAKQDSSQDRHDLLSLGQEAFEAQQAR